MDTLSHSILKIEATVSFIRKTKSLYKSIAKAHSTLGKRYQDSVKKLVSENPHYDQFFENHRKCMLVYINLQHNCQDKFLEMYDEMKTFNTLLLKTCENLRIRKKNYEEYQKSCRKILGSPSEDDTNRKRFTQKADKILKQNIGEQNSLIVQEFRDIADNFIENAFLKAKMCMVYQFNAYQGKFCKVDFNIEDLRKELSQYLVDINSKHHSYDRFTDSIPENSQRSKPAISYVDLSYITNSASRHHSSKQDQDPVFHSIRDSLVADLRASSDKNSRRSLRISPAPA